MYGMNQGMMQGMGQGMGQGMNQGGMHGACCHPPVYAQPIASVAGGIGHGVGVGIIAVAILILIALGVSFLKNSYELAITFSGDSL